jgi:hypothetical protein
MKHLFLFTILSISNIVIGQQTCEMQFELITAESGDSKADTIYIDLAQTSKKFALNFRLNTEIQERFVIDSVARKVVELTREEDKKLAYLSDLEDSPDDELYGYTTAYEIATNDVLDPEEYRLISEKKTLFGWNCQKVEFLEEGSVIGTGWIALGLFIGIEKETGFFATDEGTIVEYSFVDKESGGFMTLKLLKSSKTIANPAVAFSLEVPSGYELDTMDEDYYDDEEEGE